MSNSYAPISAKLGQAWMMRDHIVGSTTAATPASTPAPAARRPDTSVPFAPD